MAIAKVQSAISASGSASRTTTLPSSPTTNNLIIAVMGGNTASGSLTMTQPAAAAWTRMVSSDSGASNSVTIFAHIVAAGESSTYTATASGANTSFLAIYEFSGNAVNIALNIPASNYGSNTATSATALQTAIITPGSGKSAFSIAGIWWAGGTSGSGTPSVTNSYTATGTATDRGAVAELAIASTSGSTSTTFGWLSARSAASVIAVIEEALTLAVNVSDTIPLPSDTIIDYFYDVYNLSEEEYLTVTDIPNRYDDLIFVADQALVTIFLYEQADDFFLWFG